MRLLQSASDSSQHYATRLNDLILLRKEPAVATGRDGLIEISVVETETQIRSDFRGSRGAIHGCGRSPFERVGGDCPARGGRSSERNKKSTIHPEINPKKKIHIRSSFGPSPRRTPRRQDWWRNH